MSTFGGSEDFGGVPAHRWYGVFPALVVDVVDPDQQGRVRIRVPGLVDPGGAGYEAWARLATMMAGNNRGTWFIPDVDDEVLVSFAAGEPSRPIVIGALWNGQDAPPEQMDGAGDNHIKSILSRQGVRITLDDTDGDVKLRLETPGGHRVVLGDGDRSVLVSDSNGNSIKLEAGGITVTAASKVTINGATAEVNAGMVTVNAGLSKFSGVVQCDTLISNAVVSASYTPGAGNVW